MSEGPKAELTAQRVVAIIARETHAEEGNITASTTFQALQLDSLDAATITFALEEEFRIVIPGEQIREFKTVGDVIGCVEELCTRSGRTLTNAINGSDQ